ncbi:TIGR00282 family metallophosphoesterase [Candidatus Omnitrophota bacterium]
MKALFIGDIVGSPGREALAALLPELKKEFGIEICVANAENASGGAGITPRIADELFSAGIDVLTSGDHTWDRREVVEYLDKTPLLLRPANYAEGAPGFGSCVIEKNGKQLGVLVLQGRVFMPPVVDSPFSVVGALIASLRSQTPCIIVDMHAEATSEKVAMGHFLDGKVSAVVGTHTHIQTADEKILPEGTAYITDVGMAGPCDSVIGQRKDRIIEKFVTGLPVRFEVASDDVQVQGVVLDVDENTGKTRSIQRIQRGLK